MKINIGKPDRTRANIIQVPLRPELSVIRSFFTPTGNKKANEKETRAYPLLEHRPRLFDVRQRWCSTSPPPSSSLPPSLPPSPLVAPRKYTRERELIKRLRCPAKGAKQTRTKWGIIFAKNSGRDHRINSFVLLLFIHDGYRRLNRSLVSLEKERERESKTEKRVFEGKGARVKSSGLRLYQPGSREKPFDSFRGAGKIRFKEPRLALAASNESFNDGSILLVLLHPYLSVSKVPITQPRKREKESSPGASRLLDSFNLGNRIS